MADFVLDASVFIADFTRRQTNNQAVRARLYLDQIKAGAGHAHIPSLMPAEVCGALARETKPRVRGQALAIAARRSLGQFAQQGSVIIYPLDAARMQLAIRMAIDYGLKGADATYAALSDELGLDLVTFDENNLAKPLLRGGYARVVVPT
jgi:predicted nucleic acid-binding protein